MSSNTRCSGLSDSEGIQRLVWPARSPDLNPIENEGCFGRQVAGRNYPPTNKNTLIHALIEEWDKLPQQLLDNVVQSVGWWGEKYRVKDLHASLGVSRYAFVRRQLETGLIPEDCTYPASTAPSFIEPRTPRSWIDGVKVQDISSVTSVSRLWTECKDHKKTTWNNPLPLKWPLGCGSPVVKISDHCRHVMSSKPVPLKTRRVGQRCTLNLLRSGTSSRWWGVVVRRQGACSGVIHVT
ncbi:hypothetical protein TNCV_2138101 [Trichonephila clavipes]|nr:hypothetical protein TNCV_2138101 [Trichonephila clavipes]